MRQWRDKVFSSAFFYYFYYSTKFLNIMTIAASERSAHVMSMINSGYKILTKQDLHKFPAVEDDGILTGVVKNVPVKVITSYKILLPQNIEDVTLVKSADGQDSELILWTKY